MSFLILSKGDKLTLDQGFASAFGGTPERYFSAPGRTEIGGNHTDHQRGRVLAAAVNLDTRAAVRIAYAVKSYSACSAPKNRSVTPNEARIETPLKAKRSAG